MAEHVERQLLTVSELATRLRLGERTVLKMIHKGEIPCLRIASQWRFIPDQIDEWLLAASGETRQPVEPSSLSALITTAPDSVPLSRLSEERFVVNDIQPGDIGDVLLQLAKPLANAGFIDDLEGYAAKLLDRESMVATAVGKGFAIPHLRNPRDNPAREPVLIIGICPEGTEFNSLDGKPTRVFFLVVAENEVIHLRLLARLSRFLLKTGVVDELSSARTPREVVEVLMREDHIYRTD